MLNNLILVTIGFLSASPSCLCPQPPIPDPSSAPLKAFLRPFCSHIMYNGRCVSHIWILAACKTSQPSPSMRDSFSKHTFRCTNILFAFVYMCHFLHVWIFCMSPCFGAAPCPYPATYALSLSLIQTHTHKHTQGQQYLTTVSRPSPPSLTEWNGWIIRYQRKAGWVWRAARAPTMVKHLLMR